MPAGKTHHGLSMVPVPDAASRRSALVLRVPRWQHPREQPSDHGRLPSSIPDLRCPHHLGLTPTSQATAVTLRCDSSMSSGKSRVQLHHNRVFRGSLVRECLDILIPPCGRAGSASFRCPRCRYIFCHLLPIDVQSSLDRNIRKASDGNTERHGPPKLPPLSHDGNSCGSCAI